MARVSPNDTAREAARAVFAQLRTAPAPVATSPVAIPETPPQRPLPRGSLVNMLV
jgi:hypothetical protein